MNEFVKHISEMCFEPRQLNLTARGLCSVNWDRIDSDFSFVFSNERTCRVHSVLAEFLSPKIARIRQCDPFCSDYTFNDDPVLFSALESLVESLNVGKPLVVNESNYLALLQLSRELENTELSTSLIDMMTSDIPELTPDDCLIRLRGGIELGVPFSNQCQQLTDALASQFYLLSEDILGNIDLEIAQLILSSPHLRAEDEDSLYKFVLTRVKDDIRFIVLFGYVYFEYLSEPCINDFALFAGQHLLQHLDAGLWAQICRRLVLPVHPTSPWPHKGRKKTSAKAKPWEENLDLDLGSLFD